MVPLIILLAYLVLNLSVVLYFRYIDANTGWLHYYHRKANEHKSNTRWANSGPWWVGRAIFCCWCYDKHSGTRWYSRRSTGTTRVWCQYSNTHTLFTNCLFDNQSDSSLPTLGVGVGCRICTFGNTIVLDRRWNRLTIPPNPSILIISKLIEKVDKW